FVLAQNIFVELDIGPQKVLKPSFDSLLIFKHFFGEVISIDVNANRANDAEFLPFDRDRRAFEFSCADVQLVVQLVFIQELTTFQINQQICCAVAQVPASHVVFKCDQRVRGVSQIVQQDLDAGVWK